MIPSIRRSYSNYKNQEIDDIAKDNWHDFNKLLELHGNALKPRRTPSAKRIRHQIEKRLKKIAYRNWHKPIVLQQMQFNLFFQETEFANHLSAEIDKRLKELELECFRFPPTEITGGSSKLKIVDREKKGLLLAAGYRTGLIGLYEEPRRKILNSLYLKEIPRNTGIKDIEKWGDPETSTRLKKIVYSLAHLTK